MLRSLLGLWVLAAGAFAAVFPGSAAAQTNILLGPDEGEVRALVIGIDAYRYVRPLRGAVADARDLDGALRRMGVKDVTTLIDEQATRESVLSAIGGLQKRTRARDLVFIAIAGHGTQEPERVKGSQPDGFDNVFLMPDFNPKTREGRQNKIIGTEFNHFIRQFEAAGARVMFVADACHGAGLTREIDPRAEEMSYRQVPRYVVTGDELKPISTTQDAFLTPADFDHTVVLAAVDRKTKAPEINIPDVGWRGALSYAIARSIEGKADIDGDGRITIKELFTTARQVVYQLSNQRQNIVTQNAPTRSIETDVAYRVRAVKLLDGPEPDRPPAQIPVAAPPPPTEPSPLAPVRIASLDGDAKVFVGMTPRQAPFEIVSPGQNPDIVWDQDKRDTLAGGDVIAYGIDTSDLPSVIDRFAAVRELGRASMSGTQPVRIIPDDRLYRDNSRLQIEVSETAGRALILFNIAGDGTVQLLYPVGSDPAIVRNASYRFPVRVRSPFGADHVVAITSKQRMNALEEALRAFDQRRTALQALRAIERLRPPDARIGTTNLFTAR